LSGGAGVVAVADVKAAEMVCDPVAPVMPVCYTKRLVVVRLVRSSVGDRARNHRNGGAKNRVGVRRVGERYVPTGAMFCATARIPVALPLKLPLPA